MKKRNKPNKPKWDAKWMAQLLAEPDVAEKVAQLTAKELELFKHLLYKQGIYQRYVIEQQQKQLKAALKGA